MHDVESNISLVQADPLRMLRIVACGSKEKNGD